MSKAPTSEHRAENQMKNAIQKMKNRNTLDMEKKLHTKYEQKIQMINHETEF